jgi:hypothetical protein
MVGNKSDQTVATEKQMTGDELGDLADSTFSREDLMELSEFLDAFTGLTKPPTKDLDPMVPHRMIAFDPSSNGSKIDYTASREMERQGPLILRPTYCRFLLTSHLCGWPGSRFKYHEVVAAFDEASVLYGTFFGMPRLAACGVIAKLLVPEVPFAKETTREEPIDFFFEESLPKVQDDLRKRTSRMEFLVTRTAELQEHVVPPAVLAEISLENLWPPMPPLNFSPAKLPEWMHGVRQWEDEMQGQDSKRFQGLRAHTEAVIRGEIIVNQLLEPEVLHFVSRFRPLFVNLFMAYHDWPSPKKEDEKHPFHDEPESESYELGHMSFVAFLRFLVDFGVYPDHVNYEEVRNIYKDAEAVTHLPRRRGSSAATDCDEDGVSVANYSRGEKTPQTRATVHTKSSMSIFQNVDAEEGKKAERSVKCLKPSAKLRESVAKATAAAITVAEELMPRVDLRFFERPIAIMSPLETKTLLFFAAVDEWLSERFTRLADLVIKSDVDADDARIVTAQIEKAALVAAMLSVGLSPSGEVLEVGGEEDKAKTQRSKQEEEAAHRSNIRCANAAAAEAVANLVPDMAVSAAGLLEIIRPIKAWCVPPVEEVEHMFRLLLGGPGDGGGRWGMASSATTGKTPAINVFQLDKVLRHARVVIDKATRWSCSLMRTEAEQTPEERLCCEFLSNLHEKLLENSLWTGGQIEDIFADCLELTPEYLLAKATELGVSEDLAPPKPEDLRTLFVEVVGRRECILDARAAYRAIAFMLEGRRLLKLKVLRSRLQCLTHSEDQSLKHAPPQDVVFGLAAFVECLLKVAFHRLAFKGSSDIQRGCPAWWKSTWLLTLLTSQFTEKVNSLSYEREIVKRAMQDEGSWEEAFDDIVGLGAVPLGARSCGLDVLIAARPRAQSAGIVEAGATPRCVVGVTPASGSGVAPASPALGSSLAAPRPTSGARHRPSSGNSRSEATGNSDNDSSTEETQQQRKLQPLAGGRNTSRPEPPKDDDSASVASARSRGSRGSRSKDATASTRKRHSTEQGGKTAKDGEPTSPGAEASPPRRKKQEDRGRNQDAEIWWRKVQTGVSLCKLTRNVPTMEWLAIKTPDLFEAIHSEAPVPEGQERTGRCRLCEEQASQSGWGNPSCLACSGVDTICLPISEHLFAGLLQSRYPGQPASVEESRTTSKHTDDLTAEDIDVEPHIERQITTGSNPGKRTLLGSMRTTKTLGGFCGDDDR